jgi:hypothetical protein
VSGGSHLKLSGAAGRLEADATGESDLELTGLSLQHLTVRLSGASHAKVQADQTIAAQVSGASSLTYLGTPRFTRQDASANSTIRSAWGEPPVAVIPSDASAPWRRATAWVARRLLTGGVRWPRRARIGA